MVFSRLMALRKLANVQRFCLLQYELAVKVKRMGDAADFFNASRTAFFLFRELTAESVASRLANGGQISGS